MSECHLSAEIYIKNIEDRENLIQIISNDNKEVELVSETLHIESFLIDEIISINGMMGGHPPLDIEFKKWVKQFKPDIVLTYVDFEEDETKFGLLGNKKVTYKKALDLLKGVSKRIETGITMEGSERTILEYLEENTVSPSETFQGIKHVDRVIVNRAWKAIEYFIDRGLDPNHRVRDHQTASISYDYLIHCCISYEEGIPLLIKCIANGADVNVLDHNKHNLLHLKDYSNKELFQKFIHAGINVNQLDKECRTPLLHMTKDFFQSGNPKNHFDEFIIVCDMLIEAGAEPYIFDKYGAGILLYARNHPDIQKKLLNKWPDLKIHDPEKTYDTAVSSLFRASRLRKKFYDICISESVFQPFFDESFIEFIYKSSHNRSPEIELDILKNAMYIMKLACSIDNLDIVKRVESLNFPLNMPVEIGTTLFEESQKNSSKDIYSYLQKNQYTDDATVNFRAELEKCIEEVESGEKKGNDISQYYSKTWKKQIEEQRDRAIGWGSDSVERTLNKYIQKEFMSFITSNKKISSSGVWRSNIYIDLQKRQGAIIEKGKVLLITPTEVFEKIGLKIRET